MPSKPPFDNLVVVLVATRNPLNIGAVARAMSNFGVSELRIVNPYDVAFREARSAVGAAGLLKKAQKLSSVADAIADCALVVGTTAARDRKLDHPLRTLQQGAAIIRRKAGSGKVALLIGSEKRGLSNEDLSYCDWLMRIPTQPEQPSMNLGQAAAVCLYEISRQSKGVAVVEPSSPVVPGDLERITELLQEALTVSGYTRDKQNTNELRRLVRRLKPSHADSTLLLGMLRQMLWKMKQGQ